MSDEYAATHHSSPITHHSRLRLFVAVELPDAWRAYLAARMAELERLAPGYARWVAPELLHLTVLFLGEQPPARLAS